MASTSSGAASWAWFSLQWASAAPSSSSPRETRSVAGAARSSYASAASANRPAARWRSRRRRLQREAWSAIRRSEVVPSRGAR